MGEAIESFPFQETLFFPLSANPAGFNHFAAAEWLLRARPSYERVVFIPSNGHHPDPTKADPEAGKEERMPLLQTSIAAVGDPAGSGLARAAETVGERLKIDPGTMGLWDVEFEYGRAVLTAELVKRLRKARPGDSGAIQWFAGSDLIQRMSDMRIFSSEHLQFLSANCHFPIIEREKFPLEEAVQTLFQTRDVKLDYTPFLLKERPPWLAPYLGLSSTLIRNAAEAGDPLDGMLPGPAARMIAERGLYRPGPPARAPDGHAGGGPMSCTPLQLILAELRHQLEGEALALSRRLEQLREAGLPHGLAVVETSAGGWITVALAGRNGASRYFKQSCFAYDDAAKESLSEAAAGLPAVSEEMAAEMARAIALRAETDFGLAETGMAGPPSGARRSMKNGRCHIALATPGRLHSALINLHPFLTRREHQLQFAIKALSLCREWLTAEER